MGHVSISIRRIATVVVADNLCVFPPDKSILDGRRRPPCRTKLIRKWRSLGEPLFRVDCTPPNGNGLLPPFSNLCTSICSFSFPWVNRHTHMHTHTGGGPRNSAPRNRFIPSKTPHHVPSPPYWSTPLSPRFPLRSKKVLSTDFFSSDRERDKGGEKRESCEDVIEGKVFGNWFSNVGLGDCFGFKEVMYSGSFVEERREKFLC